MDIFWNHTILYGSRAAILCPGRSQNSLRTDSLAIIQTDYTERQKNHPLSGGTSPYTPDMEEYPMGSDWFLRVLMKENERVRD